MKKKLLTIFIWGIILISLTGCAKKQDVVKIEQESKIELKNIDVSLTVKEDTLSDVRATLILKNSSNVTISYGNPYWLEKEREGNWYILEPINDIVFTLPAFGLKSNESIELIVDWEYGYGKLSSGKYRIVKDISFEYEDNSSEDFYVAAEFIIE